MSSSKYPPRRTPPDLVWLRDSERKVVLKVERWHGEPQAGSLCFYAPHFYRHDSIQPWLCGEPISWPDSGFETPPKPLVVSEPDGPSFAAIHAEILSGIAENRFQKVVPFVGQELAFPHSLSWTMWPQAFADPGPQFAYGFQVGREGMCGITPEILFRVKNGVLTTAALAGTGQVNGPSLLEDAKEALEHNLVIEHIHSSLGGLGEIQIGQTVELVYGKIKHLFTPIAVALKEEPQFLDLVNRLHPTAALGGLPRMAAMDFLRLRGGERGRFGAPFGYAAKDEMLCVVAIRALQWQADHAWLMAGCGVVEGSRAEREWEELALKRRTTALQLGLSL